MNTKTACRFAVAALTLGAPALHAASGTWTKDASGTQNWTTTTNWSGGTVASGADFTATLGNFITNNRTITLNAPITIGDITAADTSHNYTISGANTLTLDRTGGAIPTIEVTTSTRTLTITSVIEGNDGLKKTGAGTLALGAGGATTHNYTGGTQILAGTLFVDHTGQIPASSGTVTLGDTSGTASAELNLNDTGTTVSNAMTVNAGSSGAKTISNRGNNSVAYSGNITVNDDLTILGANASGQFTISGTASTIASGKTVAFSLTNAGNQPDKFVTDSARWGGDGAITYTSAGGMMNIAISGAKTYTGGAALNAMSGTGIVEVRTSSVFTGPTLTSGAFGTGTLSIGATKMRARADDVVTPVDYADITIGNAVTFTANPTFTTVANENSLIFSGNASLGATRTLTVETGSTVATAAVEFSGEISGTGFGITKQGAGTLRLSGSNTFTGGVTLNGGTLSVDRVEDTEFAQPLGKGATPITFTGAATLAITGNGSTTRGLKLGNHANTLSVGTGATVDMSGNITDGGTFAYFYKSGEGTFNYSGAGAWNGNLHIQQGAFEVSGSGATPGPGGDGIGETDLSNAGTTLRITSSAASLSTSKVIIGSGTTVNLQAGTLRTNAITKTGTFTWGGGTLATVGNTAKGTVDRTDNDGAPSGPVVMEGNILEFNGGLTTGSNSRLDLGDLLRNGPVRYNQLKVSGQLSLAGANDTLNFEINPGFLRPTSPNSVLTGDWGTLILVRAASFALDPLSENGETPFMFSAITGIQNDRIGWTVAPNSGGYNTMIDPGAESFPMDSYYLEYRTGYTVPTLAGESIQAPEAVILFHYKVSGSVPEPGSAGLMIAGAMLLRALRKRRP